MNGRISYFMYDAAGQLVMSHKVSDGETVERISLQNGHPLAKRTGTKLTYLHVDHLGTPIRGTHGQGAGTTVGAEVFRDFSTPYGMQPTSGWHPLTTSGFDPMHGLGSNCGVTGFTTHVKDCEMGLQYMQARYYDPVGSRFLSVDPVGFLETADPGMVNRYAYTLNDPVNNLDPDGMCLDAVCPGLGEFMAGDYEGAIQTETAGAKGNVAGIIGVGSLFVPGPEDLVIAGVLATKTGQAIKGALSTTKVVSKNAPKSSPNFLEPTNPAAKPPSSADLPDGHSVREMPATDDYPNGYWRQTNAQGQPVDPSTGKPPSNVTRAEARARTHVPKPPEPKKPD